MIKSITYLGLKVLDNKYVEARKSFNEGSVLTISPNSYGISTKNPRFLKALKRKGLLVLDGVYFSLGYFFLTGKTICKNQGPEIFYQELDFQKKSKGRVFFLGSNNDTLGLISERMQTEYPEIKFETYSPPFKNELTENDNVLIEQKLKDFKPNVVFVGMTCPKQEIWVDKNIDRYEGVIFMAIGGVFDWFAGNYKELSSLWWKLNLGWLGRILQRPEILRRNLPFILIYLRDMLGKPK
jgi:N-acetylglucosaminyldiphosphoundecaprenol N-acetyl-beta-D-mannosaminyltransferase